MQEEAKWDFAAHSHGKLVDATTYNIRRERRDEFIGEASAGGLHTAGVLATR